MGVMLARMAVEIEVMAGISWMIVCGYFGLERLLPPILNQTRHKAETQDAEPEEEARRTGVGHTGWR
jgi:hypothetical protein